MSFPIPDPTSAVQSLLRPGAYGVSGVSTFWNRPASKMGLSETTEEDNTPVIFEDVNEPLMRDYFTNTVPGAMLTQYELAFGCHVKDSPAENSMIEKACHIYSLSMVNAALTGALPLPSGDRIALSEDEKMHTPSADVLDMFHLGGVLGRIPGVRKQDDILNLDQAQVNLTCKNNAQVFDYWAAGAFDEQIMESPELQDACRIHLSVKPGDRLWLVLHEMPLVKTIAHATTKDDSFRGEQVSALPDKYSDVKVWQFDPLITKPGEMVPKQLYYGEHTGGVIFVGTLHNKNYDEMWQTQHPTAIRTKMMDFVHPTMRFSPRLNMFELCNFQALASSNYNANAFYNYPSSPPRVEAVMASGNNQLWLS